MHSLLLDDKLNPNERKWLQREQWESELYFKGDIYANFCFCGYQKTDKVSTHDGIRNAWYFDRQRRKIAAEDADANVTAVATNLVTLHKKYPRERT